MAVLCALIILFFMFLPTSRALAQSSLYGGPSWNISGDYEVKFDYRNNFSLNKPKSDDLFRSDQELRLRWSYQPSDSIALLIEGKILSEHEIYAGGGGRKSVFDPDLTTCWVQISA